MEITWENPVYRVCGNEVYFVPSSGFGETIKILYVPCLWARDFGETIKILSTVLLQLSEMIGGQKYNWFIIYILLMMIGQEFVLLCVHHIMVWQKLELLEWHKMTDDG